MNNKRKINKKNLVILIAILSLVGVGTGFLIGKLVIGDPKKNPTPTPEATATASASTSSDAWDSIDVTSTTYQAYKAEGLDFKFVIATFHVKGDQGVNISLDHFVTSENVKLNDVNSYQEQIVSKSMSLSNEKIVSSIQSTSKECDAKVLIPVKDVNATSITVTCDFGQKKELKFDLSNAKDAIEAFGKKETATPNTTEESYSMSVDQVFEITGDTLYSGDTEYMLPSTARIYVVHVNLSSAINSEMTISSGSFDIDGYGQVDAEQSSVYSQKYANILGETIDGSGDNYLFFVVLDQDHTINGISGKVSFTVEGPKGSTEMSTSIQ